MPTTVWMGSPKNVAEKSVVSVTASDTRLAGFFGLPSLKHYGPFDLDAKPIFNALDQPEHVWALYKPYLDNVELGDTGWHLSVYSSPLESMSATEGHSVQTTVNIALRAPQPTSISEAIQYLARIEEIFSTFSIEAFTFQFEQYRTREHETVTLIWRLGENRSLFVAPMRHQILINLQDEQTLRAVCKKWFLASLTVGLSRWLFVRALRETDDGLARFVSVAQAFEVLGRELGPHSSMPKSEMKRAVQLIKDVLSGNFDNGFISRILQLIQSSNKSSYRDVLHHMIGEAATKYPNYNDGDIREFCKAVSDTRNAVVHMTDDDKGKLTDAFRKVGKLSLQLCFWYAVCQANQMQVNIPEINLFLANNRNARHGLPNEVLERDD